MKKVIFGFTGLMASGKGTVAAYMREQHGASTHRFSTMLRDALDRFYLPHSRDNLIKLSEILRNTYGEELMAKTIATDVERDSAPLIVVDGVRRMADIAYLSKIPGFVLVEIFADIETRHARITQRSENPDDQSKTLEQFKAEHERSTEITIPEVITHATEHIDNNGTIEQLHAQIDALVQKYTA